MATVAGPGWGQETSAGGHARFTYRLRVSSTGRAGLLTEWGRCRWVWNECVAKSKQTHEANKNRPEGAAKQTCGPAQLDRMLTEARKRTVWLREGSCVPQQQVIRDFGRSRVKAQKDVLVGGPVARRAGMPQFKRKHEALPSLNYTTRGFRLNDGRLHLAGGIVLRPVWSRELPDAPSSVRVYQDSLGHWYASFVVPVEVQPLPGTGAVIGIDWGVKETATTTSDAHDLPHAEYGKKARATVGRYDRMMARRKPANGHPASKGYKEAKHLRAKAYKQVARQRQDTGRKWAKKVVRDHDALGHRGLPAEVPGQDHPGEEGCGRRHRRHQGRCDRDGPQARPRRASCSPRVHHDGLRAVRSESQARTAAGNAHLHLHRVRS